MSIPAVTPSTHTLLYPTAPQSLPVLAAGIVAALVTVEHHACWLYAQVNKCSLLSSPAPCFFQSETTTILTWGDIRNEDRWHRYLHAQYRRAWKVHFAKKTRGAWRSVKYLGRYLKRPPVAASQLRHYRGGAVVHQYYDHRTQQHKRQKISQEEMLQRYVSHIPARHFKMVRYYGFLANRKRGSLLPKVYDALAMTVREKPKRPGFAVLMKGFLGTDPYQCILGFEVQPYENVR